MKRKTLTLTLCLLACFAVISVGFAAWIITNDAREEVTGNIQVDTVTDNTMEIELPTTIGNIVFGGLAEDNRRNKWLTNSGDKENLVVTFDVTVKKGGVAADVLPTVTLAIYNGETLVSADDATDAYNKAVTNNLIVNNGVTITKKGSDVGVYTVTVTFAWGSAFGGVNPLTHYDQDYTKVLKNQAKSDLELLQALNTNYKFKVTLEAKAPTA